MADFVNAGLWLDHEVSSYDREWYKLKYPERWGALGYHHNTRGNLRLGERRILVPWIDAAGRAAIHTGRAVDVPLVKLGTTMDSYDTRVIIMRAEWDLIADLAPQEVANSNAILPRRDIVAQLMNAMADKITERENELILFGDAGEGMAGLLNGEIAGVPIINDLRDFNTLPSAQLYDAIREILKRFHKQSLLTAKAVKLLVTIDLYNELARPDSVNPAAPTPLERLTTEGKALFVREIVPVVELSSDYLERFGTHPPGTNRDRLFITESRIEGIDEIATPSNLRQFYSLDRTPVRRSTDTTFSTTGFCATSEVQWRRPLSAVYYTYPKFVQQ